MAWIDREIDAERVVLSQAVNTDRVDDFDIKTHLRAFWEIGQGLL